jgi:hypothetical protein
MIVLLDTCALHLPTQQVFYIKSVMPIDEKMLCIKYHGFSEFYDIDYAVFLSAGASPHDRAWAATARAEFQAAKEQGREPRALYACGVGAGTRVSIGAVSHRDTVTGRVIVPFQAEAKHCAPYALFNSFPGVFSDSDRREAVLATQEVSATHVKNLKVFVSTVEALRLGGLSFRPIKFPREAGTTPSERDAAFMSAFLRNEVFLDSDTSCLVQTVNVLGDSNHVVALRRSSNGPTVVIDCAQTHELACTPETMALLGIAGFRFAYEVSLSVTKTRVTKAKNKTRVTKKRLLMTTSSPRPNKRQRVE